jgi:putative transposase
MTLLSRDTGRYYRWVERYPVDTPKVISDNGPQFISKDFEEYIRLMGMIHVRTSPFYLQSNGKLERWHKSLKQEVVQPKLPLSLKEARRLVNEYVNYYSATRRNDFASYVLNTSCPENCHEE